VVVHIPSVAAVRNLVLHILVVVGSHLAEDNLAEDSLDSVVGSRRSSVVIDRSNHCFEVGIDLGCWGGTGRRAVERRRRRGRGRREVGSWVCCMPSLILWLLLLRMWSL
jgi:hypothetical protein